MGIVLEDKVGTAVHYLPEGVTPAEVLPSLGLTAADVNEYPSVGAWEASPNGAARKAGRLAKVAERTAKQEAKRKVAEQVDPDLASTPALAVIYLLWNAVDSTQIPAKVKQAVNIYADELGLPRVV